MDFQLTEEQVAFKKSVRRFAEQEVWPRAEKLDRVGQVPYDLVRKCADLGIQGVLLPQDLGGSESCLLTWITGLEELARGDASLATTVFVGYGNASMIQEYGTPEMKRDYVSSFVSGAGLGAFGLTEPGGGSDNRMMQTTVEIRKDRLVVNGTKAFITNAGTDISTNIVLACAVKSERTPTRERQFCYVVVPNGTPGYTQSKKYRKLGWRSSDTRECHFENVEVPLENLITPPRKGEKGLNPGWKMLSVGRLGLAATSLGISSACLHHSLSYAKEREQFGAVIGSYQRVQDLIIEQLLGLETSRLLTQRAAWQIDNGIADLQAVSLAKLHATESAKKAADLAVQVHGGYGFLDECPASRYYRDVRVHTIGDGTSEIQKMMIARSLGLRGQMAVVHENDEAIA